MISGKSSCKNTVDKLEGERQLSRVPYPQELTLDFSLEHSAIKYLKLYQELGELDTGDMVTK